MALTNQGGTFLGPLTSTWTQPDECSFFWTGGCTSCTSGYFGQSCASPTGDVTISGAPSCWPPRQSGVADHTAPFSGWGYYSPGLECPAGWTSACSATYNGASDWEVQFSLRPSETAIGCCPSGYQCTNILPNGQSCFAVASTKTVLSTGQCKGTNLVSTELITFPSMVEAVSTVEETVFLTSGDSVITSVEPVSVVTDGSSTQIMTLFNVMFQLNHQPSDISTGATATSASASAATSSASDSDGGSSGLSKGAKAGIGIGVAAGVVLLVVAIGFLLRRRRRGNGMTRGPAELGNDDGATPQEMTNMYPQQTAPLYSETKEIPPQEIYSPASTKVASPDGSNHHYSELPANNFSAELPA